MSALFSAPGAGFLAVALVVAAAWPALAQDAGPPERRGAAFLSEHCGMCHAVGLQDASMEPQAPALRRIGRRVPLERLEANLGAGLLGGHPAMPTFTFDPREVAAIMRYLRSIQEP
jgi:mono/diheme cytochrome c family protein